MTYIPSIYGKIDSNNSSSTILGSNGVFTGLATDVLNYAVIIINLTVDQSSAVRGFSYQFSSDAINWDLQTSSTITVSNSGTNFAYNVQVNPSARYFRIVYTNGSTALGTFRLQTLLNGQSPSNSLVAVSSGITGRQVPLTCSVNGILNVNETNGLSAFGDSRKVKLNPLIQFNFAYGLNNNYVNSVVATGGTATSTNQLGIVTTTTTSGSSAEILSKRFFRYRDGMGGLARFTAIFSAGKANNVQTAGCGDSDNGYFFGYNGTSFGILYRRNAVDTWIPQSSWNRDNLLGVGGSSNSSNFNLNPLRGNVYQIVVGYLGFANPQFFVLNPYTNTFLLVHVYDYLNLNTVPIVTNPNLTLSWRSLNTGTTASTTTVSAGSGSLFVDGIDNNLGALYGAANSKITTTNPVNIITLRNNTTINGVTNKSQIKVMSVMFSAIANMDSRNNRIIELDLLLNPTVGGPVSFTNINATNSIAAIDVGGTTITGGTTLRTFNTCFTNNLFFDLSKYNVILYPGDRLVCSRTLSATANSPRSAVAINWLEQT